MQGVFIRAATLFALFFVEESDNVLLHTALRDQGPVALQVHDIFYREEDRIHPESYNYHAHGETRYGVGVPLARSVVEQIEHRSLKRGNRDKRVYEDERP